jgi:hypothetical protein
LLKEWIKFRFQTIHFIGMTAKKKNKKVNKDDNVIIKESEKLVKPKKDLGVPGDRPNPEEITYIP